ncbi:FecCD family ABC transporter permease [Cohnella abietis]|uniref:Iron compound ABC transporter permease n=1 Tax=Cohnella abietis TaxID=2507935 RepID=A0A3T1CYK4_9BACL|nr:iron ABC transporter permease [Cohnella abietis]BBI30916.1 iron compound ABC transporter permease [Cohnella abietis]
MGKGLSHMPSTHSKADRHRGGRHFSLYMLLGAGLLLLGMAASISLGAARINIATAWQALFQYNHDFSEHQVIRFLRLPRTIADIIVGASLAVCGAVMQGSTRNPLADSGLMGISSGAAFGMAVCFAIFPNSPYMINILYSCMGASIATLLTYTIASVGARGMTPQRLVLAGMSISMLFGALTTVIVIKYRIGKSMLHWSSGSTASAGWVELAVVTPLFLASIAVAISISRSITMLSMGEEVASGLGLHTKKTRLMATLIILVLTGLAVVIVGPIGFVGLIIPHAVRFLIGVDYRYIIPMSALYGAAFLLIADIFGRLYNRPSETPLGIIFAIVGVPFFLYISRKIRRDGV